MLVLCAAKSMPSFSVRFSSVMPGPLRTQATPGIGAARCGLHAVGRFWAWCGLGTEVTLTMLGERLRYSIARDRLYLSCTTTELASTQHCFKGFGMLSEARHTERKAGHFSRTMIQQVTMRLHSEQAHTQGVDPWPCMGCTGRHLAQ